MTATPLLREAPLPIPALPMRLPLAAWAALIHLRWVASIAAGSEAAAGEVERAAAAAAWLGGVVADGETALVVTHGAFRRLLVRPLVAIGWRAAPGLRRYHPWSTWVFERKR